MDNRIHPGGRTSQAVRGSGCVSDKYPCFRLDLSTPGCNPSIAVGTSCARKIAESFDAIGAGSGDEDDGDGDNEDDWSRFASWARGHRTSWILRASRCQGFAPRKGFLASGKNCPASRARRSILVNVPASRCSRCCSDVCRAYLSCCKPSRVPDLSCNLALLMWWAVKVPCSGSLPDSASRSLGPWCPFSRTRSGRVSPCDRARPIDFLSTVWCAPGQEKRILSISYSDEYRVE